MWGALLYEQLRVCYLYLAQCLVLFRYQDGPKWCHKFSVLTLNNHLFYEEKVTLSTVGRISVARQSWQMMLITPSLNLKFKFGRKTRKNDLIDTKKVIVIIKSFWAWCQMIMSRWCWRRNYIFRTHFGVLSPFLPALEKECVLETDSIALCLIALLSVHHRCVLVQHCNIWPKLPITFLVDNKAERLFKGRIFGEKGTYLYKVRWDFDAKVAYQYCLVVSWWWWCMCGTTRRRKCLTQIYQN